MKKIFFSSVGRRVELLKIFRKEIKDLKIYGGDYTETSPALWYCDEVFRLPFLIDENYIEAILTVCIKEKIDLVIPLIDWELILFSKYKNEFENNGINIMVSSLNSIKICLDKKKFYDFFKNYSNIKLPYTCTLCEFEKKYDNFQTKELIIKPRYGANSKGVIKIPKESVLTYAKIFRLNSQEIIVQEYINKDYEVTVDCYINRENKLIELSQRKRLKVRGGEVERAVTIKDPNITNIAIEISKVLPLEGIINFQILLKNNEFYLCEINPRFGGGFPLGYYSGANLIEHLINEYLYAKKIENVFMDSRYTEGSYMLRYDKAIYTNKLKVLKTIS